jgi:hypothetical protein
MAWGMAQYEKACVKPWVQSLAPHLPKEESGQREIEKALLQNFCTPKF